ncbi:hypothetical protein Vadar_024271 [Vaccinium darrowii]|uniref:Uncharacterized protein n=1 Tax=Vaccinium darrowii TaxID=229202 RepID=A0ACB7Z5X9_9ERIC|nr:hypothetical protein Vadar_024271 [Vaccinium darrowii]
MKKSSSFALTIQNPPTMQQQRWIKSLFITKEHLYDIPGSYTQRCCAVYHGDRQWVAEIKRKESLVGAVDFDIDVFRLVVQPEMVSAVAGHGPCDLA